MTGIQYSPEIEDVQTALAELAKKLDSLPDQYRQCVAIDLERLIDRLDIMVGDLSGIQTSVLPEDAGQDWIRKAVQDASRALAQDAAQAAAPVIPPEINPSRTSKTIESLNHEILTGAAARLAKRQADLLEQADERFRLVCQVYKGVIYEWDMQTGAWICSTNVTRLLGVSPNNIPASRVWWTARIHPDDLVRLEHELERARQVGEGTLETSYRIMHTSGYWIEVLDRIYLSIDKQGHITRAVGTVEDVTDNHRLEKMLTVTNQAMARTILTQRKTEAHFRVALVNAPVAVFSTDRDLRYTSFFGPAFGFPADLFIGRRDDDLAPYLDLSELMAMKQKALAESSLERREITFTFNDQVYVLLVSIEPEWDEVHQVTGLVGAYVDLSEQRRLERIETERSFQLEVNQRLVEQRESERQQLAHTIHEGPIQSLASLGFAIQLAREMSPPEPVSQVLKQVTFEIKDLIAEMRWITNELRPAGVTRFGLTRAIENQAFEFRKKYPDIELNLTLTTLGNQLPQSISLALFRIYQECITNVLRHAHADRIDVRLAADTQRLVLEIEDNGEGFNVYPEWIRYARQGHTGLVGMRERVEGIGGRIKVRSAPGQGTLVRLVVPMEALKRD